MIKRKYKTMKITRSYSRKLNIGNYQTLDHFCSVEQEIDDTSDVKEMEQASKKLEEFCVKEVERAVEESKKIEEEKKRFEEEMTDKTDTDEVDLFSQELNFKDVKLNGD